MWAAYRIGDQIESIDREIESIENESDATAKGLDEEFLEPLIKESVLRIVLFP